LAGQTVWHASHAEGSVAGRLWDFWPSSAQGLLEAMVLSVQKEVMMSD
jgi:hypothetical protein